MDATGWTIVISAVGLALGKLVEMVLMYKREQAKLAREQAIADKLDENTRLTKAGSSQASSHAATAAAAATDAKEATAALAENLDKKLNGELDDRIKKAIDAGVHEVTSMLQQHTEQDEANFVELRNLLKGQ